ncbi:MAG: hypothetical protein ACRDOK_21080 [Streptosporangiaceae bacterium]
MTMTERTAPVPPALTWHAVGGLVSVAIDAAASRHILGRQVDDGDTPLVVAEVSRQLLWSLPYASDGLPVRVAVAVLAAIGEDEP